MRRARVGLAQAAAAMADPGASTRRATQRRRRRRRLPRDAAPAPGQDVDVDVRHRLARCRAVLDGHRKAGGAEVALDAAADALRQRPQVGALLGRQVHEAGHHAAAAHQHVACGARRGVLCRAGFRRRRKVRDDGGGRRPARTRAKAT
jgi:hypothetical protein